VVGRIDSTGKEGNERAGFHRLMMSAIEQNGKRNGLLRRTFGSPKLGLTKGEGKVVEAGIGIN